MSRSLGDALFEILLRLIVALGASFLLFVEVFEAYPLPLWFYGLFAAVFTLVFFARFRFRPLPKHWAAWASAMVILVAFFLIPWNPRKPFLRNFNLIEKGMSEEEVRRIMAGYESSETANGWIFRPKKNRRFDSDWGEVYFQEGRVDRIFFSPD